MTMEAVTAGTDQWQFLDDFWQSFEELRLL